MHLGKVPGGGYAVPKSSPKIDPKAAVDDLEEVKVTVTKLPEPAYTYEEPMPEIVVQARKIPWYAWAAAGVAVAALFSRK